MRVWNQRRQPLNELQRRHHRYGAMADLDSSADGKLSAADAKFSELKLWVDANSDGHTDAGELKDLVDMGVIEINLDFAKGSTVDTGGLLSLVGSYTGPTAASTPWPTPGLPSRLAMRMAADDELLRRQDPCCSGSGRAGPSRPAAPILDGSTPDSGRARRHAIGPDASGVGVRARTQVRAVMHRLLTLPLQVGDHWAWVLSRKRGFATFRQRARAGRSCLTLP